MSTRILLVIGTLICDVVRRPQIICGISYLKNMARYPVLHSGNRAIIVIAQVEAPVSLSTIISISIILDCLVSFDHVWGANCRAQHRLSRLAGGIGWVR